MTKEFDSDSSPDPLFEEVTCDGLSAGWIERELSKGNGDVVTLLTIGEGSVIAVHHYKLRRSTIGKALAKLVSRSDYSKINRTESVWPPPEDCPKDLL